MTAPPTAAKKKLLVVDAIMAAKERATDELTFDGDVDDAGAFAHHARERTEDRAPSRPPNFPQDRREID